MEKGLFKEVVEVADRISNSFIKDPVLVLTATKLRNKEEFCEAVEVAEKIRYFSDRNIVLKEIKKFKRQKKFQSFCKVFKKKN